MWVIARAAKTSTGVQYIKEYTNDEPTEFMSQARTFYSEIFAKGRAKELGGDWKAIRVR